MAVTLRKMIDCPAQSCRKLEEKYRARSFGCLALWTGAYPMAFLLTRMGLSSCWYDETSASDSVFALWSSHSWLHVVCYREQEQYFIEAEKLPWTSAESHKLPVPGEGHHFSITAAKSFCIHHIQARVFLVAHFPGMLYGKANKTLLSSRLICSFCYPHVAACE